jgi:amidophosphoribosyltransferase
MLGLSDLPGMSPSPSQEQELSEDIHHECGVAALYWLDKPAGSDGTASSLVANNDVVPLLPSMLLDLQNRGQLAAGMSSFNAERPQILSTFKDLGTVSEAFRMSHPAKHKSILKEHAGRAAIGHTRYATCGLDDVRFAQPFERAHGRRWKWFSFAFNGQLANFTTLRDRLLSKRDYHFTLNTDTEIIMHSLAYRLRGEVPPNPRDVMASLGKVFDGAYNIVFLDAKGRMFVARDGLGFRPMCWAVQGRLFAAASESVALSNMGFTDIQTLRAGEMIIIDNGKMRIERFVRPGRSAHCFFEWVYFSNVASTIDGSSVYMARARSGERLAELEDQKIDKSCIVVPVPDTAKAAADAFAYRMGIPCVEGLIRNRYVGRTFIQPPGQRGERAKSKYTPLPSILAGKRVFLLEDSIVRSTTLATLANQIRGRGGAREVHVRVACPPIISPCFYGIDMSTLAELFVPKYLGRNYRGKLDPKVALKMARALGVDSLRYLDVEDLDDCITISLDQLCLGCVTGKYPSIWGEKLAGVSRRNFHCGKEGNRTYE